MLPKRSTVVLLTSMVVAVLATGVAAGVAAQMGSAPWAKRHKLAPPRPAQAATPMPGFGAPLAGLQASDRADFNEGLAEFQAIETPEGGLGPIFNDSSCAACHSAGAIGGSSERTVTRFGRSVNGVFSALDHLGGSLLQAKAIDPAVQEHIPPQANVIALRLSTPLFGAGLIEAIPDAEIELNAARRQPDGVQGRVSRVLDVVSNKQRVGRFGWKAQQATLLAFAGDAYLNEMGVTSRLFPTENAPNGRTDLLALYDKVPDVEDSIDPRTGKSDIDHAADFMRLLAPPPRLRSTAATLAGERLFAQANCAARHVPVMFTSTSKTLALSHQTVALYSDLLLHDMGRLGDGIEQASAKARDMRTAPLWGLRARPRFLHDGRASTVTLAIGQHDGEAARSRQRFEAMTPAEKQQLLAFLMSI